MVELPFSLRSLLVQALDEYCERLDTDTDADVIAEAAVEHIETIAEEFSSVDAEDIVPHLEATMEKTNSLVIELSDYFDANPDLELAGEEILQQIERLCEVEWTNPDGEEEDLGFFGNDDGVDEEY